MLKQKTKFKETEIERILPLVWNSYQHMYDARKTNIQNDTNFLLVIISFLSVVSITLFTYFENEIFLFSALFQLIAFVVLLKSFFIKGSAIHWFEFKETLKNIEQGKFNEDLFASLKTLENDTYTYLIEMGKITKISLYCIIVSLYSILLAFAVLYFEKTILYVLVITLTICLLLLICVYYKKQPKFNYDENYKKYKKEIEKWLKK